MNIQSIISGLYIASFVLNFIILILIVVNYLNYRDDSKNHLTRLMMLLFNFAMLAHLVFLVLNMPLAAAVTVFILSAIGFFIFAKDYI